MASLIFSRGFANAGAVAAVAGFASTAVAYAGKMAFALEKDDLSACQGTGKTKPAPCNRKRGLSIAPQFDGLNCFETMITK
ncbi:hypothetical protein R1sor_002782 [Riccia sorocarpa]|uniref:Uncharacterized protein n=1 Tax=Riccia sorocarpa TaxID=122646 RepID=A0ABD3H358_9MARC